MSSGSRDDASSLYEEWFDPLRAIAVDQFGIAEDEAEQLVHDVLLSSLTGDPNKRSGPWLRATMLMASRRHAGRER